MDSIVAARIARRFITLPLVFTRNPLTGRD